MYFQFVLSLKIPWMRLLGYQRTLGVERLELHNVSALVLELPARHLHESGRHLLVTV